MADGDAELPGEIRLEQNYPNPFNPTTAIRYSVPAGGDGTPGVHEVRLAVFNLLGREVAVLVNERVAPGSYTVTFEAGGLPSGIYFCHLRVGRVQRTIRMILAR